MNRYESYQTPRHRVALGSAALAITMLAIGVLLVAPATMTPTPELRSAALSPTAGTADVGTTRRMRVDVIAVREPAVAAEQARNVQAKHKQQT